MASTVSIFVSHNHKDSDWCRKFVQELRALGADVWYDEYDLLSGRLFQKVEREIKKRPIFIPVLSPDAISSEWVKAECELALTYQLKLSQERVFLPVQAINCTVEGFIDTYKRISTPKGGTLEPEEAARQVGIALGLLPLADGSLAHDTLPTTAEDWCIRGRGLRMQGRPAEALEAFDAALALDPQSVQALIGKGGSLEELDPNNTGDALAAYTKAIEIDRTSAQAYGCRGGLLGRSGRVDDALNDMNRAIRLNPSYFGAWYNKSIILKQANRLPEALDALTQAQQLDPTSAFPWTSRGNILRLQGRQAEALAAYEHVLALEPDDAMAANNKGNALNALGRPKEALLAYEDALRIDSEYGPAWCGKGDALWKLGQYERSLEAYSRAATIPIVPTVRPWLSNKLILMEKNHVARALSGAGSALLRIDRPGEARDHFSQAVEQDSGLFVAWLGLGEVSLRLDELEQALDAFNRALAAGASTSVAWNWIAIAYARLGQQSEAIKALDMAIAADQNSLRFWINKFNMLTSFGRAAEARAVKDRFSELVWSNAQAKVAADETSFDLLP